MPRNVRSGATVVEPQGPVEPATGEPRSGLSARSAVVGTKSRGTADTRMFSPLLDGFVASTRIFSPLLYACLVLMLTNACIFDANYTGGQYTCTDGKCPSGLVCSTPTKTCLRPIDASVPDTVHDAMLDARIAALTCADPGIVTGTGGTFMGSTAAQVSSSSSSMCSGAFQNGKDAVFRVSITAGQHLMVSVSTTTGGYPVNAYVIASCPANNTPACEGTVAAAAGSPINLTPTAGQHFVVVDNPNPALSGNYTLTLLVN
jgi:hypothetical protein